MSVLGGDLTIILTTYTAVQLAEAWIDLTPTSAKKTGVERMIESFPWGITPKWALRAIFRDKCAFPPFSFAAGLESGLPLNGLRGACAGPCATSPKRSRR